MRTHKFCPKCGRELDRLTDKKYIKESLHKFSCEFCYEDFYRFEAITHRYLRKHKIKPTIKQ